MAKMNSKNRRAPSSDVTKRISSKNEDDASVPVADTLSNSDADNSSSNSNSSTLRTSSSEIELSSYSEQEVLSTQTQSQGPTSKKDKKKRNTNLKPYYDPFEPESIPGRKTNTKSKSTYQKSWNNIDKSQSNSKYYQSDQSQKLRSSSFYNYARDNSDSESDHNSESELLLKKQTQTSRSSPSRGNIVSQIDQRRGPPNQQKQGGLRPPDKNKNQNSTLIKSMLGLTSTMVCLCVCCCGCIACTIIAIFTCEVPFRQNSEFCDQMIYRGILGQGDLPEEYQQKSQQQDNYDQSDSVDRGRSGGQQDSSPLKSSMQQKNAAVAADAVKSSVQSLPMSVLSQQSQQSGPNSYSKSQSTYSSINRFQNTKTQTLSSARLNDKRKKSMDSIKEAADNGDDDTNKGADNDIDGEGSVVLTKTSSISKSNNLAKSFDRKSQSSSRTSANLNLNSINKLTPVPQSVRTLNRSKSSTKSASDKFDLSDGGQEQYQNQQQQQQYYQYGGVGTYGGQQQYYQQDYQQHYNQQYNQQNPQYQSHCGTCQKGDCPCTRQYGGQNRCCCCENGDCVQRYLCKCHGPERNCDPQSELIEYCICVTFWVSIYVVIALAFSENSICHLGTYLPKEWQCWNYNVCTELFNKTAPEKKAYFYPIAIAFLVVWAFCAFWLCCMNPNPLQNVTNLSLVTFCLIIAWIVVLSQLMKWEDLAWIAGKCFCCHGGGTLCAIWAALQAMWTAGFAATTAAFYKLFSKIFDGDSPEPPKPPGVDEPSEVGDPGAEEPTETEGGEGAEAETPETGPTAEASETGTAPELEAPTTNVADFNAAVAESAENNSLQGQMVRGWTGFVENPAGAIEEGGEQVGIALLEHPG